MRWPEDYKDWSGSFDELVEAADTITHALGIDSEDDSINARLVRHYQSVGTVGRGIREGRKATYDYRNLAELVAVRHGLKKGWSLKSLADVVPETPTEDLSGASSTAPLAQASMNDAQKLIQQFKGSAGGMTSAYPDVRLRAHRALSPKGDSGGAPHVSAQASGLSEHGRSGANVHARTVTRVDASGWLTGYIDTSAVVHASDQQIEEDLAAFINTIRNTVRGSR